MGSIFRRDGDWCISYGKERKREKVSRKFAKALLRIREGGVNLTAEEIADEILENASLCIRATPPTPTIEEFVSSHLAYLEKNKKNRSARRSATYFKSFIDMYGDRQLHEITILDIEAYEKVRSPLLKTNSLAKELRMLHYMFKRAEQMLASKRWKDSGGNPFYNPFNGFVIQADDSKRTRVLSDKEETRLLAVADDTLKDIIQIALWTGMRQGEILALQWDWVDFGDNLISIPKTSKKNKRPHQIPMSSNLRSLLLRRKLKVKNSLYVFPSPKIAGHLTTIAKRWRRILKKAGIKDFIFHDLRRSFASRLSDAGYSIQEISILLSHSDIRITTRYVTPDKDKLRQAVESVSKRKGYGLSTDFSSK